MSASTGTPTRQSSAPEDDQSFVPFIIMESLLEKLKMLNYDEEFIKSLKMRPLSRHYFALQTNPGEQFFMFAALSAWLIRKLGVTFAQPQEDDDPNSTVASILDSLRSLKISVDFSPNKLKKGSGIFIVQCLSSLADKVLEAENVKYNRPSEIIETGHDEVLEEETDLEALDRVEEEMTFDDDSELDEDNELDVDDLYVVSGLENGRQNEIIESNVSSEAWNLELERVMPMLKVSVKTSGGDWRAHLEMMKKHQSELNEVSDFVTSQLKKSSSEIDDCMQKITKREKLINAQFDLIITQYRALQEELSSVNEKYVEVNVGVVERQKSLNHILDNVESVKHDMEERGATMSDGSPLVYIKKAIQDIKKEISEMDINIAVAEHIIVETKLRDKSLENHMFRTSGVN